MDTLGTVVPVTHLVLPTVCSASILYFVEWVF